MSLEWRARSGSLAWSNPLAWWWSLLTLVSGVNIAVWFLLYRQLHEQPTGGLGGTYAIPGTVTNISEFAFAGAVSCKPADVDSRAMLADMHLARGDEAAAVAEFERIAVYAPTRVSTYARLFALHVRAGRTDRAYSWSVASSMPQGASACSSPSGRPIACSRASSRGRKSHGPRSTNTMRAGSVPSTRGASSHVAAGLRHSSVSLGHHPYASNTSRGTSRGTGGVARVVTLSARARASTLKDVKDVEVAGAQFTSS